MQRIVRERLFAAWLCWLVACAGDADTTGTDINAADMQLADAQVEDAQVEDAQVEDAQVEDAQVEDAQVEDANDREQSSADAQVEDASVSDAGIKDKDSEDGKDKDSTAESKPAEAEAKPAQPMDSPSIGAWGFDVKGMDTSVKPGESFYQYANGTWLKNNTIPADRTSWSSFTVLALEAEAQVQEIVAEQPDSAPDGSNAQKIRDLYAAFVDTEAIEQAGMAPAEPGLARINAAATHEDIARLIGSSELGLTGPIGGGISIDEKDPDRYVVAIGQSGLGLPDRDYYLNLDESYAQLRTLYREHIARMLMLAGTADPDQDAQLIVELETQIADRHWPIAMRRDRELTYNLRTREALKRESQSFPWDAMLGEAGLAEQNVFVVAELSAVQELGEFFVTVPVQTWVKYLRYHYLVEHSAVLPAAVDDESFAFYGRTLNGQPEQRTREKRGVAVVNDGLGEAVGQLYVKRHFPESYKKQMQELVENLRSAFGERIRASAWMSDVTKEAALKKLDTFMPKVGYPDKWRDYSDLEIRAGDAFGNLVRRRVWEWNYDVKRLGQPTDRSEWFMTPQTVNAYYNPTFNEVVFPAAILQPPFFDPEADAAINYGGIGAVIGHEMGHGFDDQGAKSDDNGVLRTWWQPEDETAFQGLVDRLVAQYDTYEVLPGLFVNGRLTVGENIGDLGGLSIAHHAYHASLGDKPAPELDGWSGDQRFFFGWAQVWRQLRRDESLRNLVMSDPHSPASLRVDGVVRNMDPFYEAFEVSPDDALWLAPEERVHIW